ncbi:MAG: tetratricopeptide repeat protein [Capnocytophaga sp.]|nr:tetratricopeptide repeat protein [Capnocytophaga sp.]
MNTLLKTILYTLSAVSFTNLMAQRALSSDNYYQMSKEAGQQQGDYYKALELITKAHQLSPGDLDILEYLGKCYLETEQYDKARYYLKKAADGREDNYNALLYLLNVEHHTKRYSSAICYVNEMLEITPYDKNLWIRKITLYDQMGNKEESVREAKRLAQIFPDDTNVQKTYTYILNNQGKQAIEENNYDKTRSVFEQIVSQDPTDKDGYNALIKNELQNSGDKQQALHFVGRALVRIPDDSELIRKKIALLDDTGQYSEALVFLKSQQKSMPQGEYRQLYTYLSTQAAAYYENEDPYLLYQKIWAANPRQDEMFAKMVNIAIGRGYDQDAAYFLDTALRQSPDDKNLLAKRLSVHRKLGEWNQYERMLTQLYRTYPQDADIVYDYNLYQFDKAKKLAEEQQLYEAKTIFNTLAQQNEFAQLAHEQLYAIAMQQRKFDEASQHIEQLLADAPQDPEYLLRKSQLLYETDAIDQAYEISKNIHRSNPGSQKYADHFRAIASDYLARWMKAKNYAQADRIADQLLVLQPERQTYIYAMNAATALQAYDKAANIADSAVKEYSNQPPILGKAADVYIQHHQYDKAVRMLEEAKNKVYFDSLLVRSLAKAYYRQGRHEEQQGNAVKANERYAMSVATAAGNNPALDRWIANAHSQEAVAYINEQLKSDPDNSSLLVAKGKVFEKMKVYDSAWVYQKRYKPLPHEADEYNEHLNGLKYKSYKNQTAVYYSKFESDSTVFRNAVATLEYIRQTPKNTYGVRVNYNGRQAGTGVQLDLEWTHVLSQKMYTKANYYISNKYFPKHKAALSLYNDFGKDWEAELGGHFTHFQTRQDMYTAILGIAKTYDSWWFNARLFGYSHSGDFYSGVLWQGRRYLNQRRDYLMAVASLGTAPYDDRLDFQNNALLDVVHSMVGAGVQHSLTQQLSLGIFGNYYSYKISKDRHMNQFQLTLMLMTKF